MRKTLAALATAATLAVGTVAAPAPAEARCVGCAIGAGLVAGALIGTAIATAPVYGAYYGPGVLRPALLLADPQILGRLRLGLSPRARLLLSWCDVPRWYGHDGDAPLPPAGRHFFATCGAAECSLHDAIAGLHLARVNIR